MASSMHEYCFSIWFSACVCEKFGRKFGPFLSMLIVSVLMLMFSKTCMSVVRTCMMSLSMASAIIVELHIHVCWCVFSCFLMMDESCGGFFGVVVIIFLMVVLSISCVRCRLWHHMWVIVGIGGDM